MAHLLKAVASQWSAECFGWASGDGLMARMQKSLPAEARFGSERDFTGFLTEQVDNGFLREAKGRTGIVPLSETLFNLSPALGEFFIWSRKLGSIHDPAIAPDGADARPQAPGGNDTRRHGEAMLSVLWTRGKLGFASTSGPLLFGILRLLFGDGMTPAELDFRCLLAVLAMKKCVIVAGDVLHADLGSLTISAAQSIANLGSGAGR